MSTPIDLRSDTVTRPTAGMREAMLRAPLGDDVLGDDPTVRALEERVAALLGKDGAVFVPSGTMANQIAIKVHTRPGDEVICHEGAHIIHYEGGGPAALSGCMVRGLSGAGGQFTPAQVKGAVRADNVHFARSRLLVVENTHNRGGGAAWSVDGVRQVCDAARERGLIAHMDGARLWNACAATGAKPADYAGLVDSVACCFSKGLGAPVGSAVAGTREFCAQARRVRKLLGGGMRQAGVLAGAALHALDHHVARLPEDHARAQRLADAIVRTEAFVLDAQHIGGTVQTNIVLWGLAPAVAARAGEGSAARVVDLLRERGVLVLATGETTLRAVTHLDVDDAGVERAIDGLREVGRLVAGR